MTTTPLRVPRGVRTGGRFASTPRPEPSADVLFGLTDAGYTEPPVRLHAIGFNDEQTSCDSCGRQELRGTVVLADDDGVEVARMGTMCAGRTLRRSLSRQDATRMERHRRADVVRMLAAGEHNLERGHLAAAEMEIRDARRRGLHRPAELELAAGIEHGVELARRAKPERWGYQSPGRPVVELDTREQAQAFAQRLARHGARLVQHTGAGWQPTAA
ncbi:hypothetical protein [Pseudactinotalea terrae]|uniref:hypothetical protein n=1 Tax=Pseudactinotalea terrae TaxID=1743262 RepID=UPI0012E1960F|nr:hypothetical protein [Pseudactinotalea terrae]